MHSFFFLLTLTYCTWDSLVVTDATTKIALGQKPKPSALMVISHHGLSSRSEYWKLVPTEQLRVVSLQANNVGKCRSNPSIAIETVIWKDYPEALGCSRWLRIEDANNYE